jgi:hypothetical protein
MVRFINSNRLWKSDRYHFTILKEHMKKLAAWVMLAAFGASVCAATNLPFVDDDYAKARAEAKRRKLPLFVDVWAPW